MGMAQSNMQRHHFELPEKGSVAREIIEKHCFKAGDKVIVAIACGNGELSHIDATIVACGDNHVRCSDGSVYHRLTGMCVSQSRTYQAIHRAPKTLDGIIRREVYKGSIKRQAEEAA